MKVVAVVDDLRPRMAPQRADIAHGDRWPAQHRKRDRIAVLLDPFIEIEAHAVKDLDPKALKRLGVVGIIAQIVRPELDHVSRVQQALDDREHGPGPGVLVGLRDIMVDDQMRSCGRGFDRARA